MNEQPVEHAHIAEEAQELRAIMAVVAEVLSATPIDGLTDDTLNAAAEMLARLETRTNDLQHSVVDVIATRRWEEARNGG